MPSEGGGGEATRHSLQNCETYRDLFSTASYWLGLGRLRSMFWELTSLSSMSSDWDLNPQPFDGKAWTLTTAIYYAFSTYSIPIMIQYKYFNVLPSLILQPFFAINLNYRVPLKKPTDCILSHEYHI